MHATQKSRKKTYKPSPLVCRLTLATVDDEIMYTARSFHDTTCTILGKGHRYVAQKWSETKDVQRWSSQGNKEVKMSITKDLSLPNGR